QEVSLCSYLVQVCSRLLCPSLAEETTAAAMDGVSARDALAAAEGASTVSKAVTAGGALGVLDALEACFPARQELWWAYQLCLTGGIRQFRAEKGVKEDGTI
ncbi:unnamed protein product, partial [Sphacelaria rigidula]